MKKLIVCLAVLTVALGGFSQAPQKMSYQCVIRNLSGALVANQSVGIKISISQGTPTGTVVYQEIFNPNPQTNANGLLGIEIGGGLPIIGTFSAINWAAGPYFLKTETDPAGGTSYTISVTSQLLSVPYALNAKKAEEIADNSVTNSKIASNAVTVTKLPTGATSTTFLRGDGTWQVPLSNTVTPGGADGNIQYNYRDVFTATSNLHWDYVNYRLGIGTNAPNSKVHIVSNSTQTNPHLKLYESEADYARLTFQNNSGANYWSIAGLNHTTNSSERFNIFNSVSGNVMSVSGIGNVAIGTDPNNTAIKFWVKDEGNVAAIYAENNGSLYTLYAKNLGTGPAAYFDGTINIGGGNTSEVNRSQTGSANLVPICYGTVSSSGAILSGSGNFSVDYNSTDKDYTITINGETYSYSQYSTLVTHIGSGTIGFPSVTSGAGVLNVTFYMPDGTKKASYFSFLVYKP